MGRCDHRFCHRFTQIDSLGLHGHASSCGLIDEDGDLPTAPQGRLLARASENVLQEVICKYGVRSNIVTDRG
jgi:hypothetical protein